MTENEIKKALEIHAQRGECAECPYAVLEPGRCQTQLFTDCLKLFVLKDAEVNRWKFEYKRVCTERDVYIKTNNLVKAETIKEFLNKAERYGFESSDWSHFKHPFVVEWEDLMTIYDEMVGEG